MKQQKIPTKGAEEGDCIWMNTVILVLGIVYMSVLFPLILTFSLAQFVSHTGMRSPKRVLIHGEHALVKIVRVRQTKSLLPYRPVLHFLLEVHPSRGNAYRLARHLAVPVAFGARMQPGTLLAAKVDPHDREQIAFDFRHDLTAEERAITTTWEATAVEDLISPAEQACRTINRLTLATLSLISAMAIFLMGLALVMIMSVGS
jgi:hypothetical protein